jgi:riboflavin biosynthesis pyrimidine reductase
VEGQASEVERSIRALYGERALATRGVVHVTAVVRTSDAVRVIRIGEGAPKSDTDFFVLNLCRARADAILTTAENLRREPALRHDLQGGPGAALARFRREVLGKEQPPTCAILTRSGDLPLDHAVWSDWTRKVVLSTRPLAPHVAERLDESVRLVCLAPLDVRAACAWLEADGASLISIEAGPSTARALYAGEAAPGSVDELLLSLYEGKTPAPLGGALPATMTHGLELTAERVHEEPSGRWRFQRWARER